MIRNGQGRGERKLLVNELARQMAGGNAEPNPSMVEDAESMIPAVAAMIDTPELFKAAINAVIKAQGVSPDGNQPAAPPPGYKVIP